MYIKPRKVQTQDGFGLAIVYDPERKDRLPPEGRDVPDTPYWRRRIAEGGVEFADPPKAGESVEPVSTIEDSGLIEDRAS